VDLQVTVWQLVLAVALAALAVGVAVGRYVVPDQPDLARYELPGGTIYFEDRSQEELDQETAQGEAKANVRASIPAVEAWYADHQTYAGMTLEGLRGYDAGIKAIEIRAATATGYCVESTVRETTFSKPGPAADIVAGRCAP
jgi:hypothetical protein